MKAKKYFLSAILGLFILGFSSCEEKPAEAECSKGANMQDSWGCEVPVIPTFCSDGVNKSYYTYNEKKYECTGVDANTCGEALDNISADLISKGDCAKSKINIEEELTEIAKTLLTQVKSESLCK